MYTPFIIIRSAVFFICLSVLFLGCDSRSELPQKPEIVYKKIIAKTKGAPGSTKTTPGKVTPTALKKLDLVIKPKADISRTRAVKISKKPSALSSKPQKGILQPKSDISRIKIAKKGNGVLVKVGQNQDHPMMDEHFIEWIEIIADGVSYRKFLKPGDKPQAEFEIKADKIEAREYCNVHGLWKS